MGSQPRATEVQSLATGLVKRSGEGVGVGARAELLDAGRQPTAVRADGRQAGGSARGRRHARREDFRRLRRDVSRKREGTPRASPAGASLRLPPPRNQPDRPASRPFSQGADGRDHNPYGFSVWLAGGGIKGGITYGATDEFGYHAVENICTVYDLWATVLDLLGVDHEELTYRYSGRDYRLTDVHGRPIREIMA